MLKLPPLQSAKSLLIQEKEYYLPGTDVLVYPYSSASLQALAARYGTSRGSSGSSQIILSELSYEPANSNLNP